jgi:hypothetical protein
LLEKRVFFERGIFLTISFRFCKVLEFKNTKGYFRPLQLTIEGTEEEAECKYIRSNIDDLVFDRSELETNPVNIDQSIIIKNSDLPPKVTISHYDGYIDLVVKKKGKVFNQVFYRYLEPNEFIIYHIKELNLFMFGAAQDVVDGFIREMNSNPGSGMKLEAIEIDFTSLQPLIPVIIGVWFGDMNKQYLRTAGYFGKNVDKSEEFNKALQGNAKISQLLFNYTFKNEPYTVGITRTGSVILYSRVKDPKTKIPDQRSEIQLAIQILINFILPGFIVKTY